MNGNEEQRAEALARRFLGGDLSRRSFLRRAGGLHEVQWIGRTERRPGDRDADRRRHVEGCAHG